MSLRSTIERFKEGMQRGEEMADHFPSQMLFDGENVRDKMIELSKIDPKAAAEYAKIVAKAIAADPTLRYPPLPLPAGIGQPQRPPSDVEMLEMRMRWGRSPSKLDCVHLHRGKEKMFVFVVNKDGNACHLEDDLNMFPSDQLVSSLRILER